MKKIVITEDERNNERAKDDARTSRGVARPENLEGRKAQVEKTAPKKKETTKGQRMMHESLVSWHVQRTRKGMIEGKKGSPSRKDYSYAYKRKQYNRIIIPFPYTLDYVYI